MSIGILRLTHKGILLLSLASLAIAGYALKKVSDIPQSEEDIYDPTKPWKRVNSGTYVLYVGTSGENTESAVSTFIEYHPQLEIAHKLPFENSDIKNKVYLIVRPIEEVASEH